MHLNDRVTRLPRRSTAVFATLSAALLLAASSALLAPGIASAVPGDDITDSCLEMSQGGGLWVSPDDFNPTNTGYIPIPGDSGTVLTFDVRNTCAVPATLTLYSQNWSVADGGTATVQGQIGSQKGQQVQIGPGKDSETRIELTKKAVTPNAGVMVGFILGIPGGEVVQGNQINGGWGLMLVEDEAAAVVAPGAPTGLTLGAAEVEAGTPVKVSGKAEPGSTVTVTGGGATCTATADTNGNFSCDLTIATVGDHSITATATNACGTSPASTAVTVKVAAKTTDPGGSSSGSLGSLDLFGSLGS